MLEEILSKVPSVEIYPIISFILFFAFFIGILIWTFRVDKNYTKRMKELPLDAPHLEINNGERNNG